MQGDFYLYATVSGWLKIKNPNYTQSERRHELSETFKTKQRQLSPIPKKPPQRSRRKEACKQEPIANSFLVKGVSAAAGHEQKPLHDSSQSN